MTLFRTLTVHRDERLTVLVNGAHLRTLGPGRHWVWTWNRVVELVHHSLANLVEAVEPLDPVPRDHEGTRLERIADHERGVVRLEGVPMRVLGPGTWRVWDASGEVTIDRHDVLAEPVALAARDRLPVEPHGAMGRTEVAASEGVAVVLQHEGAPVRVFTEGRYRAWHAGPWRLRIVPLHQRALELAVQDLVTHDQVTVRVRPAARFRVVDPVTWLREGEDTDAIYGAVQLAAREVVAGRTLDELVEDREALSTDLLTRARKALPALGVELEAAFVKDVILPADVKALAHRVSLARKEAEAHAIRRRAEVAATRQLANTAKMLERSPVLLRLKELEALGDLADRIDKLVVVGGGDLARQVLLREGREALTD